MHFIMNTMTVQKYSNEAIGPFFETVAAMSHLI